VGEGRERRTCLSKSNTVEFKASKNLKIGIFCSLREHFDQRPLACFMTMTFLELFCTKAE
jgi:hypothetical protein